MKLSTFFKIISVLILIWQSNTTFAMKRKRDHQEASSNNKIKETFNCPYNAQECMAKQHGRILVKKCDNNKQNGFCRKYSLEEHLLRFHRVCPICPEQDQIPGTSTDDLVAHIKKTHPKKKKIYRCETCKDYICLESRAYNNHVKKCADYNGQFAATESEHTSSNNFDNFFQESSFDEILKDIPNDFFNKFEEIAELQRAAQETINNKDLQSVPQKVFITQNPPSQIPYLSESFHSRPILPSNNTTQFHPNYQLSFEEVSVLAESFQSQNLPSIQSNNNNDITTATFPDFENFENLDYLEDEQFSLDQIDLDQIDIDENAINQIGPIDKSKPQTHRVSRTRKNNAKKNKSNISRSEGKLACNECERQFKKHQDLFSHILNKHRLCPWCTKFKEQQDCLTLQNHATYNHGRQLLVCRYCADYIATKACAGNLGRHESTCKKNPTKIEKINAKLAEKNRRKTRQKKSILKTVYPVPLPSPNLPMLNMDNGKDDPYAHIPSSELVFEVIDLETDPLFSDEDEAPNNETVWVTAEHELFDNFLDRNLNDTLLINPLCRHCNPSHQEQENGNITPYLTDDKEETCPNCGW